MHNIASISALLGFTVKSAHLAEKFGITPAANRRQELLYTPGQVEAICIAWQLHIGKALDKFRAEQQPESTQ